MFKFRSNSGQKCSPEPEPEFRSIYGANAIFSGNGSYFCETYITSDKDIFLCVPCSYTNSWCMHGKPLSCDNNIVL